MPRKAEHLQRLPKAPLAEVVFELRWKLPGPEDAPAIIKSDPGLLPLLETFTSRMKKLGFGHFKDMSPPLQTGGYGVARRYFRELDKQFPMMQIGHGIFATNETSLYEWKAFHQQIRTGLKAFFESYPKLGVFAVEPSFVELRYIDAFDKSLLGKAAMFDFLKRATTLKVELPSILRDTTRFVGEPQGRFVFVRDLKGWKNSRFVMDFGSGKRDGTEDIVRLETKIQSDRSGVPEFKTYGKFMNELDRWLEFAHGTTSPFFKEFILPEVMTKFSEA